MNNDILIAYYVIAYFEEKGETITNLKLQKLLYYIQAWGLVFFEERLFEELPQAWVHGPVYRAIYHSFKERGAEPLNVEGINAYLDVDVSNLDKPEDFLRVRNAIKEAIPLENKEKKFELIDEVLEKYGSLSAFNLEHLTHKEEPWNQARKGYSPIEASEEIISDEHIKDYYSKKLQGKALQN